MPKFEPKCVSISLPNNWPETGKLGACDLGKQRTGLAISDEGRNVAFPRPALKCDSQKAVLAALREWILEEKISALILGNPLLMDGGEGGQSKYSLEIKKELEKLCPVMLMDERFTSAEARTRLLGEKNMKGHLDSEAARILLATFLGQN